MRGHSLSISWIAQVWIELPLLNDQGNFPLNLFFSLVIIIFVILTSIFIIDFRAYFQASTSHFESASDSQTDTTSSAQSNSSGGFDFISLDNDSSAMINNRGLNTKI